ncbi:conserved hypothetical protein [Gloeothece citriformis PCC 7424]|uniref:Phage tail assembly protein n=1 Tax=Gloeothece citriformis (strain PCC 7424) TaxID=65393 RepID=B7KH47_GLOC7|nr:hypothetical protein [Gloeothece citriformis]ACK69256.1 conserved hypothetical protein [Gloeothece citriformis PCC 7424]
MTKQQLITEFDFTLPRGLIDTKGRINRQGKMRLATAKDEIFVQQHPQVQENPAYSILIYLSQVITRLGSLSSVTPQLLEDLTVIDLAYLREFYNRINQHKTAKIPVQCPHCNQDFKVELTLSGEF